MTIRIDGVRLLKVFAWHETVLVGVPIVLYLLAYAGFILAMVLAPDTAGPLILVPFCLALFVGSLYFYLPGLIAPALVRCASPLPVLFPRGLAGWLVIIVVYSAFAFILALLASLYTVDRGVFSGSAQRR